MGFGWGARKRTTTRRSALISPPTLLSRRSTSTSEICGVCFRIREQESDLFFHLHESLQSFRVSCATKIHHSWVRVFSEIMFSCEYLRVIYVLLFVKNLTFFDQPWAETVQILCFFARHQPWKFDFFRTRPRRLRDSWMCTQNEVFEHVTFAKSCLSCVFLQCLILLRKPRCYRCRRGNRGMRALVFVPLALAKL